MEFSGEYHIPVPQQRVWEALNDPEILKASIAGCQALEKVSDTEFNAIVNTKVGPFSATFRGTVNLSDLNPPHAYVLTGRAQGGAVGFATIRSGVNLEPAGDATLLRYRAEAEIGGKLVNVGGRLVQTVAQKAADDFFGAFVRQLGGTPEAAPEAAEAIAPAAAGAPPVPSAAGGLSAPVPAWLVVFGAALGIALGYCAGLLAH